MKYLIYFFILTLLSASEVQITADKFMANEAKFVSVFTGHVHVTKGSDNLKADKIVIDFDKNKKPTKYTATGNAEANMTINKKKYFASGETLIYEPNLSRYTIKKNAFLHELDTDKKVYGEVIYVDQAKGYYEVESKKNEPVKFIFKIEDKKN
ncbi:MAG: lipopolysaccharide transport periplasmic protein LptA [Sulfurospirillaceae bacterium]|nr:lipopolysaccharide transport periplasmic protein LptA [Sulfurospirillaceae bacterium]